MTTVYYISWEQYAPPQMRGALCVTQKTNNKTEAPSFLMEDARTEHVLQLSLAWKLDAGHSGWITSKFIFNIARVLALCVLLTPLLFSSKTYTAAEGVISSEGERWAGCWCGPPVKRWPAIVIKLREVTHGQVYEGQLEKRWQSSDRMVLL